MGGSRTVFLQTTLAGPLVGLTHVAFLSIQFGVKDFRVEKSALSSEWQTLQGQHGQYEFHALILKAVCLSVFVLALTTQLQVIPTGLVVSLFWIQEGIFKTYQTRLADRLLKIENLLGQPDPTQPAMQLHAEWVASRPGGSTLIAGYVASACRPTVAFPYLPMLVMLAVGRWQAWL